MQIYYFNDTRGRQLVKVRALFSSPQNQNNGDFDEPFEHHYLEPMESRIFNVLVPGGHMPFIKVWENQMVLIDSIKKPKRD